MRLLLLILAICSPLAAQSIGGKTTVSGRVGRQSEQQDPTSNTQAIISYSAPNSSDCTVEVSESDTYAPLVHDVNTAKFTGAGVSSGSAGTRYYVVGKRLTEQGLDGLYYSRALQANTPHYWRTTCGASVTTGSFTTKNIPVGITYNELPQVDSNGLGVIPTFPNDRTTKIIDPKTGVAAKRLHLPGDGVGVDLGSGARGNPCSTVLNGPGPGYFCAFAGNNGGDTQAYYVIPSTGEIRYLGIAKVPPTAGYPSGGGGFRMGGVAYGLAATSYMSVLGRDDAHLYTLKVDYAGDYSEMTPGGFAALTVTELDTDLLAKLHAYRSDFNATTFSGNGSPGQRGGCGFIGVNADYGLIGCKRGDQDSYGWFFTMDMATANIIGGMFFQEFLPNGGAASIHPGLFQDHPLAFIADHGLGGGGATPNTPSAIGEGPYQTTLTAGLSPTDTVLHVAGEPLNANDTIYEPYLMDAAVGDKFWIQGSGNVELVQITAKSGTDWTVTRNSDGMHTALSWSSGITLQAECSEWRDVWWKFLVDPNPTTFSSGFVTETYDSSHIDIEPYGKSEASSKGVDDTPFNYINVPYSYTLTEPTFAGAWAVAPGNAASDYSVLQVAGGVKWFLNNRKFYGIDGYGGSVLVSGETQLYDYNNLGYLNGGAINRKQMETIAMVAGHALIDISGPGSHISGSSGDAYKYCTPNVAGECRTSGDPGGAGVVGHLYANVPGLSDVNCNISTGPTSSPTSLCFTNLMAQGGLYQYGFTPNSVGLPALYPAPTYTGFGYSRKLTSGFSGIRDLGTIGKPTVDGSVAFVEAGLTWSGKSYSISGGSYAGGFVTVTIGAHSLLPNQTISIAGANPGGHNGDYGIFSVTGTTVTYYKGSDPGTYVSGGAMGVGIGVLAVQIPPYPAPDGVDRSTFVRAPISITTPAGMGIATATVEFGYLEHGTATQYYCTSRRETCVATAATVTDSNPFSYKTTDTYTKPGCASSCSITLPVLPMHIAYYQVKFYDAGGTFVTNGASGVALESTVR